MSQTRSRYGARLASVCFQLPTSPSFNIHPTDYPHHTMAPRPGPLRDLPLERFTDVPFTPTPTTPRRTNKRPISPGTPNLFSPTKKRILAQEGVFSPEKTIKSTITSSCRASVIHGALKRNPAVKLDFGQPSRGDSNAPSSNSRPFEACFLEPSPEFIHPSRRLNCDYSPSPIPNPFSSQLLSIPSSLSNPQTKTHCPSFDVWVGCDLNPPSLSTHSSSNDFHDSDEDKENSHDDKENMRPRTKLQTGLSTRLKKVSFMSPEQPRRSNVPKIPFTPLNARGSFKVRLPHEMTPGKVLKVDRNEMKRRRELLAMELDGEDDMDDDL